MHWKTLLHELLADLGLATDRYKRQKAYLGEPGQERLHKNICIVGMGGLGTATADMLARSGVKSIKIIDNDFVEVSNLHRQTLYTETDVGKKKTVSAKERLSLINSSMDVLAVDQMLTQQNLAVLTSDIVLDCTDSLKTRFLINDYCAANNIPWIYASVAGDHGMVKVIRKGTACLRCFLKTDTLAESSDDIGILNTAVQVTSAIQVSLAMQLLLDETPDERLIDIDVWHTKLKKIEITPRCPLCKESY